MESRSRSDMSDPEFLRHIAHTAEIGDPIEESDIRRVRRIADNLHAVVEAVTNEGPNPAFHQSVMSRHRDEWPTLWGALDELGGDAGESSLPHLASGLMFGVGCALLGISGWQYLWVMLLGLGSIGVYRIVERLEDPE